MPISTAEPKGPSDAGSYPEWECRPASWYRISISIGVIWPNLFAALTNSSETKQRQEDYRNQKMHYISVQLLKRRFPNIYKSLKLPSAAREKQKNKKRGVIKLLLCFFSKWACGLWAAALYVLYIQVFTVARWESPLPSGGPSQRKPNGFCWKREKSLLFTSLTKTRSIRSEQWNLGSHTSFTAL